MARPSPDLIPMIVTPRIMLGSRPVATMRFSPKSVVDMEQGALCLRLIVGQIHFDASVDWLANDKRTFEVKTKSFKFILIFSFSDKYAYRE